MNINRDNYEMYFLMYADNELSTAERNAVEIFTRENSDLQKEFKMLMATILPSEALEFNSKKMLYKNSTALENISESLLLHLDGELTSADTFTLQLQIESNEEIALEWNLLQKTRLNAKDTISFINKQSLYRHTGKVTLGHFWKITAAASIIGAGIFLSFSLFNKRLPIHATAKVKQGVDSKKEKIILASRVIKEQKTFVLSEQVLQHGRLNKVISSNTKNEVNKNKEVVKNNQQSNIKINLKSINKQASKESYIENVKEKEDHKIAISTLDQTSPLKNSIALMVTPSAKSIETLKPAMDNKTREVKDGFTELALNDERSDNRILFTQEENITRSKLSGFFRKVKRVVERNTKITTANGLRIGGFEFVLK